MTNFTPTPFPEAVRNYMRLFPTANAVAIAHMMTGPRRPVTVAEVERALREAQR